MPRRRNIYPVGIIRSPFTSLKGMPIQPLGAKNVEATVIVDKKYASGLKDLGGFSHIYLIYCFHKAGYFKLLVKPFMDVRTRGVFATRSPLRPSGIGLSLVELLRIRGNRLLIRGCDILDGTPLLDIKPYMPVFDQVQGAKSGWMKASRKRIMKARADQRFISYGERNNRS